MTRRLVPPELLDSVVSYFKPQRVILFGSKARGEAGPDSDIDLLVIVDDDTPPEKLSLRAGYEARRAWCRLAVADIDRQTVAACMAAEPPLRASAAFHCQQAVEKLLKGFLVLAAKRFRKTHSLAQLGAAAQASFPEIAELVAAA